MRPVSALAATLLVLATADAARPGEAADFRLSQAVQGDGAARIHAYLDVWDQSSEPVGDLPATALSGTLGGRSVAVRRLVPFLDSGEGVAYIFSVDVSKSLSPGDYTEIKRALTRWIDSLRPNDRAAILTFGTQSRIAVDFTTDVGELRAALETLAPTDMTTMLYRGLHDAIEMSSRRDPGLPARRVLVVLTDGVDDHSAFAPEDVLVALREHPLPIYVVAFGRSGSSEPRELLQRFATNSGGLLVAAGGGEFETAYAEVRDAIDRVWVAELDCPGCEPDGGVSRLQVNVHLADRVLSKGIDLRLLPPLEAAAALAPGATAAPPAAPPAQPSAAATAESAPAGRPAWMLWSTFAAAVAVVVIGAALAARRIRAGAAAEAGGAPAPTRRKTRQHLTRRERKQLDIPIDSEPLVAPVALCLTVVRGTAEGSEHRFLLHRRAVLGSGGKSDFVVGEPDLASEQVELMQESSGVYARNLSRSQPTLVNGAPLLESKPLANGDLLGNRGFIARVRLG